MPASRHSAITRALGAVGVVLLGGAIAAFWPLANGGDSHDRAESRMNICTGRVTLSLPEDSHVSGRHTVLDAAALEIVPLPDGGLAALREQTIEALAGRPAFADAAKSGAPVDEFETAGAWVALYYDSPSFEAITNIVAYRPVDHRVLEIKTGSDKGREKEVLKGVAQMTETLSAHPAGTQVNEQDAFCLEDAVVSFPFRGYAERTELYASFPGGGELTVTTEVNGDQIEPALSEVQGDFLNRMAGEGFSMVVERQRALGSAPFAGEELMANEPNAGVRLYVWRYRGEPNSAARPLVDVQLEVGADAPENQTEVFWKSVIESISPVGG